MKKNLKIIPIPFAGGLNTEVLSNLDMFDGENSSLSNFMRFNNGLRKRYGISKIGTNVTATATGFIADYYGGNEVLYRMLSTGIIDTTTPASGTWSTIKTQSATTSTTRRWSYAKMTTYDNLEKQREMCIFTDNIDPPQIYGGTYNMEPLYNLCIEEGTPPEYKPNITLSYQDSGSASKNENAIYRLITSGGTAPTAVTINITNDGLQSNSWSLTTTHYFNGAVDTTTIPSFVTFSAVTGDLSSGTSSVIATFSNPAAYPVGTYTCSMVFAFANGGANINFTITLEVTSSSTSKNSIVDTRELIYKCEQGSNPTVTVNTVDLMATTGYDSYLYVIQAISGNLSSYITTNPLPAVGQPTPSSFTVTLSDVSQLTPGVYTCIVPVSQTWTKAAHITVNIEYVTIKIIISNSDLFDEAKNHYVPIQAKGTFVFANRLVFVNVIEKAVRPGIYYPPFSMVGVPPSNVFPNRVEWSESGALTIWNDDSWEDMPERGGSGTTGNIGLNFGIVFNGAAYLFSDNAIHRMNDTGDSDLPFSFDYDVLPIGCAKPETVKVLKNMVVFESTDGVIRAFDGFKSYILSEKITTRLKTDAPSCALYDNIYSRYVYNSTTTPTKVGIIDFRDNKITMGVDTEGIPNLTTAVYEESYPDTVSFLSNTTSNCYGLLTSGTEIYVVKLYDSTKSVDNTSTHITFSSTSKQYTLGNGLRGHLDHLVIKGTTTTNATMKVTVITEPGTETVTTDVALVPTGTFIPIEKEIIEFRIGLANSGFIVKGDSTSVIVITNTIGTTYRYTWNGIGTNPYIGTGYQRVGDQFTCTGFLTGGNNVTSAVITAVGANYIEIINGSGGAETKIGPVLSLYSITPQVDIYTIDAYIHNIRRI